MSETSRLPTVRKKLQPQKPQTTEWKGERRHWSGDEKDAFRRKKVWKEFVARLIEERGCFCELCSLETKALDCHHLDPMEYDNLDPAKFKLLHTNCHSMVEWWAIRIRTARAKGRPVPNEALLLEWIGPFLPEPERSVDKFYAMMEENRKNV